MFLNKMPFVLLRDNVDIVTVSFKSTYIILKDIIVVSSVGVCVRRMWASCGGSALRL